MKSPPLSSSIKTYISFHKSLYISLLALLALYMTSCGTVEAEIKVYKVLADCINTDGLPDQVTIDQKGFTKTDVLVNPHWIAKAIVGENPAQNVENSYVILECNWGPEILDGGKPSDYLKGHIPTSIHFDSDNFEDGYPTWYLRSDTEIQDTLEAYGITQNTTVILYSTWQLAAARTFWILKYAGVEDVRFLDGGYAAWVAAGGYEETVSNKPTPVADFGTTVPVHPEYLATTEQVKTVVTPTADPKTSIIVDVRKWKEHIGEISGYDYLDAKGRIPGSVWADDADWYEDSPYANNDGTLRTAADMQAFWNPLGVTSDKELMFQCGGGWRSALSWMYAYMMDYPKIKNYSCGWSQWSTVYGPAPDYKQTASGNPVETGTPR